ncbi:NACHT, LRR and PYD domains-containing protein 1b allele 3-like [Girardinichthys multiradiatus]|uniref:NACHT, LRR and PYD domains-containing protein 1b allele 3-like n=1 Tax=Girardinichthys multiradiatus TaxID=208333 RepID=UPI001FAC50AB|nr:NACHT, LRR and PYD domains-containing protein 1b allele 3-like [Girardinichthys multiradiatus]
MDTLEKITNLTQAKRLPNMKLQSSFEEFTLGSTGDEDDKTYLFCLECSSPGLYRCRRSGLVFDMKGEGDVFYRIVPWSRTLLSQHDKKPAGPLFDIRCQQQSVVQLHLPHCEIRSTGGCHFLSVAHVHDEGIEFIRPEKITETHVIISITGFSAFGIVKDEDSPPVPIRALVLLFYKPPTDPDVTSFLNVLLLPRNIVLEELQEKRNKLFGEQMFIDTPQECKLQPNHDYTLSTCPSDDSIKVQPKEATFNEDPCNNFLTSIQVVLKTIVGNINLTLVENRTSCCVWEGDVFLTPFRRQASLSSSERLLNIRQRFITRVSEPVLQSLLDKLLEKNVINDPEFKTAETKQGEEKPRFVIDTVRGKGEAASSEMIKCFCELDKYLCESLELI